MNNQPTASLLTSMAAGFFATVILSVLMVMKSKMGLMPQLDVIAMLAQMLALPVTLGWVMHFAIGTMAWGLGFNMLYRLLPGKGAITKGVVFGVLAWLGMMVMIMPMAGIGMFGAKMGMQAAVMPLVMHIVFGWALGYCYQCFSATDSSETSIA